MFKRYIDLTIDEKINAKSWVRHSFGKHIGRHLIFMTKLGVAVNLYFQQNIDCPYSKEATLFRRNWPQVLQKKMNNYINK